MIPNRKFYREDGTELMLEPPQPEQDKIILGRLAKIGELAVLYIYSERNKDNGANFAKLMLELAVDKHLRGEEL